VNQSIAAGPVSASIRRTFAALEPSEAIAKMPISAVLGTWVPPHSSRETPLDLHDAHPVSVLLAEERHRPEPLGLAPRHLQRAHPVALLDPVVDQVPDVLHLVDGERRAVSEVEAQLVRADCGAGLADVRTEPLPQRRVEQVRRSVVAHRREAGHVVDLGLHPRPRVQAVPGCLELHRLVVSQSIDVGDRGAAAVPAHDARVRHLAAALCVEGALLPA